jgi:hypothetical protein
LNYFSLPIRTLNTKSRFEGNCQQKICKKKYSHGT